MIKWKKVLAAGLGTAMLLSQTAYADTVMVPPPPFIGGSQTGNTGLGNGIVQPGVTGGQNNSAENQGGPGGAGGRRRRGYGLKPSEGCGPDRSRGGPDACGQ